MTKARWLQMLVGGLLFLCVVAGLVVAANWPSQSVIGPSVTLVVFGIVGLAVIAFWEHLWTVIKDREFSITREGIKLGCPRPADISPNEIGSIRDRWLYSGIDQMSKKHYENALNYFSVAYEMKPSILAAFRCMQNYAWLGSASETEKWKCEALALAERAPVSELANRGLFREWVLQHRDDTPEKLVEAARAIDF